MLNLFNPPDKDGNLLNSILSNLGTFYNAMDKNSKEKIKSYFNSFLVSLEGLYYNLVESIESYNLNTKLPYLDFSYNEIEIDISKSDKVPVEIPSNPTLSIVGTPGTEEYAYAISAIDHFGIETPISDISVLDNGPTTLSTTDKVRLTWTAVEGAESYNIYGRTISNINNLIGTSTTNTFDDEGQQLTPKETEINNNTIKYYLYDIPFDYYFFNINKIGTLVVGQDFDIINFKKLKFTNLDNISSTHEKFILDKAYAFLPILVDFYIKVLTNSDDYLKLLLDNKYSGYLDLSYIDGDTNEEKNNKVWAFHVTKLFHNLSLNTRHSLNIGTLEKILNLCYNAPFAYDEGTLYNVVSGGGYITFNIGNYYYKIPDTLTLLKNEGDVINKYEILVTGVKIEDAYVENSTIVLSDQFSENRLIKITVPSEFSNLSNHSLLIDSFYNNILPKNLEIV